MKRDIRLMMRKSWRAINQDKLELHKFDAVQTPFYAPDLSALNDVLGGQAQTSSMSGHALLMYNLVWQMKAQLVVEIGLGPGDSTCVFLSALKRTGGKLVSIDIEPKPEAANKVDQLGLRAQWEFICEPSERVGAQWPPERKIDLLLVDGLHTYNQVKTEFRLFRPHITPGGYVLFHDSETIRGVRKFVGQLRRRYGGVQFPFSNGLYVVRLD